jgi:hypothetical protein
VFLFNTGVMARIVGRGFVTIPDRVMHAQRLWTLPLLCLLFPTPALADITPPGAKFISHQVRFENLADYPETAFFLGWLPSFSNPDKKWTVRRLGVSGEHSMYPPESPPYGAEMALAAVPVASLTADDANGRHEWFLAKTAGVKIAPLDVEMMRTAPITDLRDTFWTVYRVRLTEGGLTLDRTRHDEPGGGLFGSVVPIVAVVVVLSIVAGVLWFRRRRPAAAG